jgi:hypothetical protein
MFPEFDENNSLNWKNNYSVSGSSGYMSFNSLVNFLSKLTSLNSPLMLFSSVFSHHRSEQHLDSATVFSLLLLLSSDLSHSSKIDSLCTESEFEDFLFHFVYRSSSFLFSFPNNTTSSSMASEEEFKAFYQLFLHVFSSPSSYFYALH